MKTMGWMTLAAVLAAFGAGADEAGFVSLFDGKTLHGWCKRGGSAQYHVEDGCIVGVCAPNKPNNTFLCTEKEYGDFILKLEFKFDVQGNSGVQFRSAARKEGDHERVFGYQAEITTGPRESTARIYDEGRRGHRYGIVWLDSTSSETLAASGATMQRQGWNQMEIQCVGPSIRTWLNGKPVVNILDGESLSGFLGLQIHAGKQGVVRWRNIRIKELGRSAWKPFFVRGTDGGMRLDGAHFVLPDDWSFQAGDGGFLRGLHKSTEKRDGLVVSDAEYTNFIVRVTYQLSGGNSALYFRAQEVNTPWLLKGFQNEIGGNNRDSALWHTAGDKTPGRGWVARNDALIEKFRRKKGWNTTCTAVFGDRIVNRLNGMQTVDIKDPQCEKSGKVALQLHGGAENEMRFKDFEILVITPEMERWIVR